jgi:hypothetical protein
MITKEYYVCVDCLDAVEKPYSNGDGKYRCEKCSITKYELNPFSKIKIKAGIYQPAINLTTVA